MFTVTRECMRYLPLLAGLIWLCSASVYGQEAVPAVETPPPVVTEETPTPTSDTTQRSQKALEDLDRLTVELEPLGNLEGANKRLEQLRSQVDNLLPEGQSTEDLLQNQSLLDGVLVRTRTLRTHANEIIDGLTTDAETLESKLGEIRQLRSLWTAAIAEAPDLPQALKDRIDGIVAGANVLEAEGSAKLNSVVELQNSTMAVSNVITPIAERLRSYGQDRQVLLFEANAAPIWQLTSDHITTSSGRSGRVFLQVGADFRSFADTHGGSIGGHLLLLPMLVLLMVRLKRVSREAPSAALARPVATGVLVWMLIGVAVWTEAALSIRTLYIILSMLTAAVVLYGFLPKNLRSGALVFLLVALAERLLSGLPAVDHITRVMYLVFGVTVLVLSHLARQSNVLSSIATWGVPVRLGASISWTASLLTLVGVLADVFGYAHLGKLLIGSVVKSVAVFLILFAGLATISETIRAILGLKVLDNFYSIARNRVRLKRVLHRPLMWLSMWLWAWVTMGLFGIEEWVIESLQAVFYAEASIGSITLSLRGVVVFILAVWLAVWSSRIVRAVLNQDVLPRMELPRGVANTISMTAHYTIITVGVLLAVGFIGLDLSSLAFIVGALGVGIGFGMQNVVNNFISGLILIFEAPIQVGDTVEVGTLMGKVVQIGIRTSRVRTFSGSEVIVPNGDLVSNQVINWTLSDRRRRLELAVGVAYGSNPEEVTSLLRATVEADEDVLKDPAPIIVFNDFGDSALNFQILAWIADFDRGFEMRHRLNTAINNALSDAGVTIPFPQRDLHVKSVPPDSSSETQTSLI